MDRHSGKATFRAGALLFLVVIAAVLLAGCAGSGSTTAPTSAAPAASAAASGQPIVWRGVTMGPRNQFTMRNLGVIADKLKTQSNGQFTIQYLGGPESV